MFCVFFLLLWVWRTVAVGVGFCQGDAPQETGYLNADSDASYFYYLATSRSNTPDTDPLVIWMTGGPGCSSLLALMTENGPCRVKGRSADGWEMESNPWSWNEAANVVWVDQPEGVGFATRGNRLAHNETQVAERMYRFMKAFYVKHPKYLQVPLFVTGESYGGHYVPAVGARLLKAQGDGIGMLKGITVGNGLVDPVLQWASHPTMAFTGGPGGSLHGGVVNVSVYHQMRQGLGPCESHVKECAQDGDENSCLEAMKSCSMSEIMPIQLHGKNPYDLRKPCDCPKTALCYNITKETEFANDPEVKRLLDVHPNRTWEACNTSALLPFVIRGDYMRNYRSDVTFLLKAGVKVLIYAGDTDFMVDWVGCRSWVEKLPWEHQQEWLDAPNEPMVMEGVSRGLRQSAHGLTYIQIYDAGHLVPMDQPMVALAMLQSFTAEASTQARIGTLRLRQYAEADKFADGICMFIALSVAAMVACIWAYRAGRHEGAYQLME